MFERFALKHFLITLKLISSYPEFLPGLREKKVSLNLFIETDLCCIVAEVLTRYFSNEFSLLVICFASRESTLAKNQLNFLTVFSWWDMLKSLILIFYGNDDLFILFFTIRLFHIFLCLFCITLEA